MNNKLFSAKHLRCRMEIFVGRSKMYLAMFPDMLLPLRSSTNFCINIQKMKDEELEQF